MRYEETKHIGFLFQVPRERMMVVCPDCGVVEGVDKERWSAQSLLANNPPVCTSCGTYLVPFSEDQPQNGDSSDY